MLRSFWLSYVERTYVRWQDGAVVVSARVAAVQMERMDSTGIHPSVKSARLIPWLYVGIKGEDEAQVSVFLYPRSFEAFLTWILWMNTMR